MSYSTFPKIQLFNTSICPGNRSAPSSSQIKNTVYGAVVPHFHNPTNRVFLCVSLYKISQNIYLLNGEDINLHQNESCTFLQMYHISLKQQEIVFTRLAGMLGMFSQGACGTMISTCCGALLHRHIIVTRKESFNTCQKSPLITSNFHHLEK